VAQMERRGIVVKVGFSCRLALVISTLIFASLAAHAAENLRPVFIKASCDGKTSSAVITILRQTIDNSQKYRLTRTLADDDKMDVVLTVDIDCTDRDKFAAIATFYGQAKCFGLKNCHLAIDGSSLRSDLCAFGDVAECARTLFKAFDDYASNPLAPRLNFN
jgi:hypothetical protein